MDYVTADARPHATTDDVIDLMESLYGLKVLSIKKLHGYEDQNFYISVNMEKYENANISSLCTAGYVVKIMNTYDTSVNGEHVAGEIDMVRLLSNGGIVCPQHVPDKNGQLFNKQDLPNKTRTDTTKHIVRVLQYIEGEVMSEKCVSPRLVRAGGSLVADMHNILEGFDDSRLKREGYLFYYDHLSQLKQHLSLITDEGNIRIAEEFFYKWDTLKDKLDGLPRGIIYYDLNEGNLLVRKSASDEWEIAAVIDFQDATYGCKVYDIAIYIVYMMILSDEPLDIAGYCLQGFVEKRKLSQAELEVLYYCIAGRFLISLIVGLFFYSKEPDPCFLETQSAGWRILKKLWALPSQELVHYWLSPKFS